MSISSEQIDGMEENNQSVCTLEFLLDRLDEIGVGFEIRHDQLPNQISFCEAKLVGSSFDSISIYIEELSIIELKECIEHCTKMIEAKQDTIDNFRFGKQAAQYIHFSFWEVFGVTPKLTTEFKQDPEIDLFKEKAKISLIQNLAKSALARKENPKPI